MSKSEAEKEQMLVAHWNSLAVKPSIEEVFAKGGTFGNREQIFDWKTG